MTDSQRPIDSRVAHIARVYDYWLGGKDNFAVDRQVGDIMREDSPEVVEGVQGNRAFLARTVGHLAGAGVRQFLDIGTGLPAADNTHEVAQAAPRMNQLMNARLTFRTRDQVTAYFAGMELVDPGVVRVPDWRPDNEAARKPL